MKKKLIAGLLALAAALSVSACGLGGEGFGDRESRRDRDTVESADEDESGDQVDLEEESDAAQAEPDDSGESSSQCTLGLEVDSDYDGFTYLYCETLMTESKENSETGKMESKSLNVFIPKGDYTSVNRDRAYTDYLGVDFTVALNPYIRYDQDDYLPEENLEYYLESEYDPFYYTDFKAIEVSGVEKEGPGTKATVKYCRYNSWDQEYIPVFATHYLVELTDDLTVLVDIKINYDEVTGKTAQLLQELSDFYGIDIEWSKEEAEKKLEAFLESPEADTNIVSTGYMIFELPKGWGQDWNWSDDYSDYCFAPDGDAQFAECVITVKREYQGSGSGFDVAQIVNSQEKMDEFAAMLEQMNELGLDIAAESYGDTVLGPALKLTTKVSYDDYDEYEEDYYMSYDGYMYYLQVNYTTDTIVENIADIVDNILATAQVQ